MNMIAPESINLTELPSFALCDRAQLPKVSAVYLAVDIMGVVQYVGKTKNLRIRWRNHHKKLQVDNLNSARIVYLECPEDLLTQLELALIAWFKPKLNGRLTLDKNLNSDYKYASEPNVFKLTIRIPNSYAEKMKFIAGDRVAQWVREAIAEKLEREQNKISV